MLGRCVADSRWEPERLALGLVAVETPSSWGQTSTRLKRAYESREYFILSA
jgi:hypothetical protein